MLKSAKMPIESAWLLSKYDDGDDKCTAYDNKGTQGSDVGKLLAILLVILSLRGSLDIFFQCIICSSCIYYECEVEYKIVHDYSYEIWSDALLL